MSAPSHQIRQLLGRLGDSERQLQLALEAADLGTWNWDATTGATVWSERVQALAGFSPDQSPTLGDYLRKVHPDDRAAARQAVDIALKTSSSFSVEYRIVLPSGELRWLHCIGRAHPIDGSDRGLGMSGVVRDVTEAHRASETVLRQKRYLEQLLQTAPTGVAKFDRQLHFMAANGLFSACLHITEPDLVGRHLYQVLPDLPPHLRELNRRCLAGVPVRFEHERFAGPNGGAEELAGQFLPWYDERGDVGGTTLIIDMGLPRCAEPAPQRGAALEGDGLPQAVAEAAPIGLVLTDTPGTISYANRAWLEISGLDREQVLGLQLIDIVHPDDRVRLRAAWQQVVRGVPAELEFRIQRTGRDTRWVHGRIAALAQSGSAAAGIVHGLADVTGEVQERTAHEQLQLQIQALTQRLRNLRTTDRAELARRLQRELSAELAGLREGLVELEAVGAIVADGEDVSSSLAARAAAVQERFEGLLVELAPPAIDGLGFAAALARYVGDTAERAGLEYELEMPDAIPAVPPRTLAALYVVAQEALGNVIRHARATRVDLRVLAEGGCLRLRIRDDGVGFASEDRDRPGRFGLLSATAQMAEIGGVLEIVGLPGKGTTVSASAPLEQSGRPRLRLCE